MKHFPARPRGPYTDYDDTDPPFKPFPRARRPFPLWVMGVPRFISPFGFACLASAALAIGVIVGIWKELEKIL